MDGTHHHSIALSDRIGRAKIKTLQYEVTYRTLSIYVWYLKVLFCPAPADALILALRVYFTTQAITQAIAHKTPKTATMTTTTTGGVMGGMTSSSHPDTTTSLPPLLPFLSLAVALLFFAYQLLVSRPRSKGGSRGPPVVSSSPVVGVPVVGTILEFGRSPVKMVQRCYDEYGPVFTVPVSPSVCSFLALPCCCLFAPPPPAPPLS